MDTAVMHRAVLKDHLPLSILLAVVRAQYHGTVVIPASFFQVCAHLPYQMVGIVDLGVIQAKQLRQLPSAAHARMPAAPVQRRCGQPGELFIGYGGGVRLIAAVDPFRRRGQPVGISNADAEKVFPTKPSRKSMPPHSPRRPESAGNFPHGSGRRGRSHGKIHCKTMAQDARRTEETAAVCTPCQASTRGRAVPAAWPRKVPSRTVGLHAVDHAEAPGKQRCAGRHAGRVGSIRPGKTHPVRRQRVDVRRRPPIPAAGQMVRPQRVDIKINDLHRTSLTKCLRPCSYRAQIISCVKKAFSAVTTWAQAQRADKVTDLGVAGAPITLTSPYSNICVGSLSARQVRPLFSSTRALGPSITALPRFQLRRTGSSVQ